MLNTTRPSAGNHDSWPYYSAAPTAASWDAAWGGAYARRTFPGAARSQWLRGGYYARRVGPYLQALMLNTNTLSLGADVDEQLRWLEVTPSHPSLTCDRSRSPPQQQGVLSRAREDGDSAIVVGHIPVRRSTCLIRQVHTCAGHPRVVLATFGAIQNARHRSPGRVTLSSTRYASPATTTRARAARAGTL